MFRVALVSCLVAFAVAYPFTAELDYEWGLYKQTYDKQYAQEVEYLRRFIWERNLQLVNNHNQEEALGLHTYKLGMNEYADLENSEFVAMLNGYKQQNVSASVCTKYSPSVGIQDLPDTVDWRKEGLVTEIKNQGQCGSCWSFSTTGSLEGQNFKKTGKLVSLSEKNLMDCSRKEGNKGCEGGLMDNAFAYVIKNNGIDTEESYPYVPRDSRTCKFKQADVGATEVGCKDISEGSESDLQSAVATVGPISVAIDASHSSFQLYRSGVYSERRCSSKKLDHGVLAVGYGTEESKDYWLVKNSWGSSWGQEGYIMMSRNKENQCGIASAASFPTM